MAVLLSKTTVKGFGAVQIESLVPANAFLFRLFKWAELCVSCPIKIYLVHIICLPDVSVGSPSSGGDATVYVKDINQPSLPTLFLYSVLVSISVFMALSTVFHSINSPDNSPFNSLCSSDLISA